MTRAQRIVRRVCAAAVTCTALSACGVGPSGGERAPTGASVLPLLGEDVAVVQIAAGEAHTCALLEDGTVRCWGLNVFGQIGDGTVGGYRPTPTLVSGLTGVTQIAVGEGHTCAVLADGTAKCWGWNNIGEVGDGTAATFRPTPTVVSGLTGVTQITVGGHHSCALLADGSVKCWGYNRDGQLGDGTVTTRFTPTAVSGVTNAVQIAAGYIHTCVLLADGTAMCWGYAGHGAVGDGTMGDKVYGRRPPTAVLDLAGATQITAGGSHNCALLEDGTAKCWGGNGSSEIGDGTCPGPTCGSYVLTPAAVLDLAGATQITAGGSHTCALLTDGTAKCWGAAAMGQIGDGSTGDSKSRRHTPTPVSGLAGATEVTGGLSHSCALLLDGTAKCWGSNDVGQLGDPTKARSLTPTAVM